VFAIPAVSLEWSRIRRLMAWTAVSTIVAVLVVARFKIMGIETGEAGDIGASTFSLRYSLTLVPVFCKALVTVKWFSVSAALFVCGIVATCRRSIRRSAWTVVVGLFFAYFVVYTGHYRSYYFVKYGLVTPFESLRYITNMFPLFAAVTGLGALEASRWIRGVRGHRWYHNRLVFGGIGVVAVFTSFIMDRSLRKELQEIEWENRIAPVHDTLQRVQAGRDYVVTDLSIVFQVFGGAETRIVDAYSVDTIIPMDRLLETLKDARTVWWLQRNGPDDADRKRYPGLYRFLQTYGLSECGRVSGPYSLCRLTAK
jgi:hypothetical protein